MKRDRRHSQFSKILLESFEVAGLTPGRVAEESGIPLDALMAWREGNELPTERNSVVRLASSLGMSNLRIDRLLQIAHFAGLNESERQELSLARGALQVASIVPDRTSRSHEARTVSARALDQLPHATRRVSTRNLTHAQKLLELRAEVLMLPHGMQPKAWPNDGHDRLFELVDLETMHWLGDDIPNESAWAVADSICYASHFIEEQPLEAKVRFYAVVPAVAAASLLSIDHFHKSTEHLREQGVEDPRLTEMVPTLFSREWDSRGTCWSRSDEMFARGSREARVVAR